MVESKEYLKERYPEFYDKDTLDEYKLHEYVELNDFRSYKALEFIQMFKKAEDLSDKINK